MDEPRLLWWSQLPTPATVKIHVDPGKFTVGGEARLRRPGGVTHFKLGPAELVQDTFELPLEPGSSFRLLLFMTYLSKDETTARVTVSAVDEDGELVVDENGDPLEFDEEYTGSIGSDSPEDEVLMLISGEL